MKMRPFLTPSGSPSPADSLSLPPWHPLVLEHTVPPSFLLYLQLLPGLPTPTPPQGPHEECRGYIPAPGPVLLCCYDHRCFFFPQDCSWASSQKPLSHSQRALRDLRNGALPSQFTNQVLKVSSVQAPQCHLTLPSGSPRGMSSRESS